MEVATSPGKVIEERYKLVRLLGEGAHGAVWLADDIHLKRPVAIKVVQASLDPSGQTIARLQREAKVLQRLDHPNIVQVFRFGTIDDDAYYLAIEYVEGSDLSVALEKGALPIPLSMHIAKQLAGAMYAAEQRGVIHRDLKPQNVLLVLPQEPDAQPIVKVADFGLCTMTAEATMQFGSLTRAGSALGTPLYMSPEQCQGGTVNVSSDIYAFGCVLFEMLTGHPPYRADTPAGVLMMHVRDPVPDLLVVTTRTSIAQALAGIISRCMAKTPRERYQSFGEVLADLQTIDISQTTARLDIRQAKPAGKNFHINKLALLAVAVVAVSAVAFASSALSTDEQRAFSLEKLSAALAPASSQSRMLAHLRFVQKIFGDATARKLAAAALLSQEFGDAAPEQKLELLIACATDLKQPPDSEPDVIADALLDECLRCIDDQVKTSTPMPESRAAQISKALELLLKSDWSASTWTLFERHLNEFARVYTPNDTVQMPDTQYSLLLEQFIARASVHEPGNSLKSRRRAYLMTFAAAARAAKMGDFELSRRLIQRLKLDDNAQWIGVQLMLVSSEFYSGKLSDARNDFRPCEEMHKRAAFASPSVEATYRNLERILAKQR